MQFVTTFMEIPSPLGCQLELILHGIDCCAAGNVTIRGTSFVQSFTLQKGEVVNLILPSSAMLNGSSVSPSGVIVILSNSSISVISKVLGTGDYDWSYVYPVDLLDKQYYIITPNSAFPLNAQFAIVSLDKATSVTATINGGSFTFQGRSWTSGSSISFQLLPFQGAQFQLLGGDLSGSYIQATEPIAVLSGHQSYRKYPTYSYGYTFEQLLPVSSWGRTFVVPPLSIQPRKNDEIWVMASQGTNVKVYNESVEVGSASLSRGGLFVQPISASGLWINADHDVMVMYVCSGSPNITSLKPFMSIVLAVYNLETSQVLHAPSNLITNLLMVTVSDQMAGIAVDGILFPTNVTWNDNTFKTLKYSWVEVTISPNSHYIQQLWNKDIWVMSYSFPGNVMSLPSVGNSLLSFNFYGGALDCDCQNQQNSNQYKTSVFTRSLSTPTCRNDEVPDIFMVPIALSWWDALRYCRQHFTDLFSVPDGTIQNLMATTMEQAGFTDTEMWIGLRRHKVWGYLYWTDGEPPNYLNWGDGEPNDPQNNMCTLISLNKNFTWNAKCCSTKLRFICY
uniref:C-type lectin domain-containing protein n=2 Tax=Pyxicephalus adspersus TaxID=30357 RepID=A0AAV3AP14_PYXAD|nr:TPA: hypothetical protein GDO54_014732 [Pyxicephalus adspersus]